MVCGDDSLNEFHNEIFIGDEFKSIFILIVVSFTRSVFLIEMMRSFLLETSGIPEIRISENLVASSKIQNH